MSKHKSTNTFNNSGQYILYKQSCTERNKQLSSDDYIQNLYEKG